jgi:ribosome modulation factor
MTRVELARALYAGQDAARAGQDITACPYPAGTLLATAWARGYGQAREATAR